MAAYTFAGTNILPAGISDWRIQGEDWVSLGDLQDGRVTATPQFGTKDNLVERPHGMLVEASAKIMSTGKTTGLAFLDKLANVQYHDLALINSAYTGGTYMYFPASSHTKWRFVMSGGHSQDRYIEILVRRYLPFQGSSPVFEDLFTDAVQAATSVPEVLFSGYAPTPATIHPAHFLNFYVRNTGESNWENPSPIADDGSLELELLTSPQYDQNGCYRHNNTVKVTFSVSLLCTDQEGMIKKLQEVAQSASGDVRLDGSDGTQFTFADIIGFVPTFSNEGGAGADQLIRVTGTGVIPLSTLDNVFV